jgi:hypothetical protein
MRLCKLVKGLLNSQDEIGAAISSGLEQLRVEIIRLNTTLSTISEANQERLAMDRTVAKEKSDYLKVSSDLIRLEVSAAKERIAIKPGKQDDEF